VSLKSTGGKLLARVDYPLRHTHTHTNTQTHTHRYLPSTLLHRTNKCRHALFQATTYCCSAWRHTHADTHTHTHTHAYYALEQCKDKGKVTDNHPMVLWDLSAFGTPPLGVPPLPHCSFLRLFSAPSPWPLSLSSYFLYIPNISFKSSSCLVYCSKIITTVSSFRFIQENAATLLMVEFSG